MTWQDRLQETIKLESPDGDIFEVEWSDNDRSIERKLGIFDPPGVDGTKVQDLGSKGALYPITLYFSGPDNDINAAKFIRATSQRGTWSVLHPVIGQLTLYLSTISEAIAPVESGNITEISTEWIEHTAEGADKSLAELKSDTGSQIDELNESAFDQFIDNVKQTTSKAIVALKTVVNKATTITTFALNALYSSDATLSSQIDSILRGVDNSLAADVIDLTVLAGQVQNLVQLPVLSTDDSSSRLTAYSNLVTGALDISISGDSEEQKNIVSTQELFIVSALGALGQIAVTSSLTTRPQALGLIKAINTQFEAVTNGLDAVQETFDGVDIDLQYFSQSQSYSDTSMVIATGVAYLLSVSFDLLIEKVILISVPTSPLILSIQEYGENDIDANFDLFIASNVLKNTEILLLPAGRTVVVYV
ncbi:MAG: DNA circularization N-terminal domain-containing protein [candidate division Zixibacteria bacterium]|nr:DNA circularization N-terminal domain-containing protein [candidate division Zixibacteria bacterium]